jgi:hypothetical protein
MFELILMTTLAAQPKTVAQIQTCQWPNKCVKPAVVQVAQFKPCVWPNKCAKNA